MNLYFVSIPLFLVGILLFFILAGRKNYRDPSAAQNYEKIRNKLTTRDQVKEETEDIAQGGFGFSIGNLIGGFIVIFIGTSLIGPISEQVAIATQVSNVTSASSTLLGLTTTMFTIMVVISGLTIAYLGFRRSGTI